jgi:Cu-Zn family superoxide dismutase
MHKHLSTQNLLLGACAVLSLVGCPPAAAPVSDGKPGADKPALAAATIEPRNNSTVNGTATFEQVGNQVKVVIEVSGATPGQHGLHIHEKGDCSDPAKTAGDHFNPGKMDHGSPDSPTHHAGDFGSITVGEDGKGKLELTTDRLSLKGGDNAIIGRSIIFHEKPDDMVTQPSGNSGARIGCGVITAKQ